MEPFLIWLLATFLAIAFLGDRPLVGLAVALLGGIAMGLSIFLRYRPGPEDAAQGPAQPSPKQ